MRKLLASLAGVAATVLAGNGTAAAAIVAPNEGGWAIYRSTSYTPVSGIYIATAKAWTHQEPTSETTGNLLYFNDSYTSSCWAANCTTDNYGLSARLSTHLAGDVYTTYLYIRNESKNFNWCNEKFIPWSTCAQSFDFQVGTHETNIVFELVKTGAVPEPATWAMMISGFGLTGAALRRRRNLVAAV